MPGSILVVEDDVAFRRLVAEVLRRAGFRVLEADQAKVALNLFNTQEPDLVVLDVNLPDKDGLEVCRGIRAHPARPSTPVVMLTAEAGFERKASGFGAGADHYLVKPFDPEELLLWVQALLRRVASAEGRGGGVLEAGDLVIDPAAHLVRFKEHAIGHLTVKEFDLLYFLVKKRPRVLSRKQILSQLWRTVAVDHVVDTHLGNLRRKLPQELSDRLQSVPGKGYRYLA